MATDVRSNSLEMRAMPLQRTMKEIEVKKGGQDGTCTPVIPPILLSVSRKTMQEENICWVAPNRFLLLLSRFGATINPLHSRHSKQEDSTKYLMLKDRKEPPPVERRRLVGKDKDNYGRGRLKRESKKHQPTSTDDDRPSSSSEQNLSIITLSKAQYRRGSKISDRSRFSRFAPIIEEATDDETVTTLFRLPDFPIVKEQRQSSEDLSIYTTNTGNTKYSYRQPHNKQARGKFGRSFDSDDMSLFTSDESLIYAHFPDSFTAAYGDDEASFVSAVSI